MAKKLVIVNLLNSSMCKDCRFNAGRIHSGDLERQGIQGAVRCMRGDCDNWIRTSAEPYNDQIDD